MSRTKQLGIRITEDDWNALIEKARRRGIPPYLVAYLILHKALKPKERPQ